MPTPGDAQSTVDQKKIWEVDGKNDINTIRSHLITLKPKDDSPLKIKAKYKYLIDKFNLWFPRYISSSKNFEITYDLSVWEQLSSNLIFYFKNSRGV